MNTEEAAEARDALWRKHTNEAFEKLEQAKGIEDPVVFVSEIANTEGAAFLRAHGALPLDATTVEVISRARAIEHFEDNYPAITRELRAKKADGSIYVLIKAYGAVGIRIIPSSTEVDTAVLQGA